MPGWGVLDDVGSPLSEADDNVIPFPRGQFERAQNAHEAVLDELPVRRQPRDFAGCGHDRTWVNEHARTVTCRDCGVALDPIDALVRLARHREFLVIRGRTLRNEVDHLTASLEKLKREERNAKARLRRAAATR